MQLMHKIRQFGTNIYLFRIITIVVFTMFHITGLFGIDVIPRIFVMVWGGILILYELFVAQHFRQAKFWPILALLSVSYAISVLLNFRNQPAYLINNAYYFAQTLLLFYPFELSDKVDKVKKWQCRLNYAFMIILFIASLISLVMYLFHFSYWIGDASANEWVRQGFVDNQLFGVYRNPNQGSIFAMMAMVMVSQNNLLSGRKWYQSTAFGYANFFVQLSYLILSGSRGSFLTGLFFVGAVYGLYALYHLVNKFSFKLLGKLFMQGILLLFVTLSLYGGVKKVLGYGPGLVNYGYQLVTDQPLPDMSETTTSGSISPSIQSTQLRNIEQDGGDVTTGRLAIWLAGIRAAREKLLFGLGDTAIYRNMKRNETTDVIDMRNLSAEDRNALRRTDGYLHNNYVTILGKAGIVGLSLYVIFLLCFGIYHLRFILSDQFRSHDTLHQLYFVSFALLASLLFTDLVESHILFTNRDIVNIVFWINAGFLNYLNVKLHHEPVELSKRHFARRRPGLKISEGNE